MSIKLRVNTNSISTKIQKLEELGEQKVKENLREMVDIIVPRIPVDTGAYAESFSVRPSSDSGGRSRTSRGRPRNQSTEEFRQIAESNMLSDIQVLDLKDNTSVRLRNRAPHATEVENRLQIFGTLKDIVR